MALRRACLLCCLAVAQALTAFSGPSKALVKALVQRLNQATTAIDVVVILKENQDVINAFVVSAAMRKLRRVGKPREALLVFDRTTDQGVAQNVFTFNAAISASNDLRDWKKALDLFDELKQRGLDPEIITYSTMISS